jgi:hypothetical protein
MVNPSVNPAGLFEKTKPILGKGKSKKEKGKIQSKSGVSLEAYLKKQSVRQGKLVQFSRYESCPAKD